MKHLFYIFYLVMIAGIVSSCCGSGENNQDSTNAVTWTGKEDNWTQLPDAGSSWYVITLPECSKGCNTTCSHSVEFKAKNVEVLKGSITTDIPDNTKASSISFLDEKQSSAAKWSAVWNVDNQQEVSISLVDAAILVQVDTGLTMVLTDLSDLTLSYLMDEEEAAMESVSAQLEEAGYSKMLAAMPKTKNAVRSYNVQNVVSWLPEICLNDDPSFHKKEKDTNSIFIVGLSNGEQALVGWTRTVAVNENSSISTVHLRRYDLATNVTLEEIVVPAKKGSRFFSLQNWSAFNEFNEWWKGNHPGKPIPNVMPPGGGLALNVALQGSFFYSNNLIGHSPNAVIYLRASMLAVIGPPGQIVQAQLSGKVE